jgi:transposase
LITPEKIAEIQAENLALKAEVMRLELQVKELNRQLHGKRSERMVGDLSGQKQAYLFEEPSLSEQAKSAQEEQAQRLLKPASKKTGVGKGPKPIDPSLPRVDEQVPSPDLTELICEHSGKLLKPGFVETIEVLCRRPAQWYVRRISRTVFVSDAKMAPVASPWPADVLTRSRVDASVVAYTAAQHYCEHQPFNRIEQHLGRMGVSLPRVNQVSLMTQLDERLKPLYEALCQEVLGSDYLHLDATPVDLCDPDRPGSVRESTLWNYTAHAGQVFFAFEKSKSPQSPGKVLEMANFKGKLQTDGASGFEKLGIAGQVVHLGCMAHARRYFFKAVEAGELGAMKYLHLINRLFRADRLSKHFGLSAEKHRRLRMTLSKALFEDLLKLAEEDSPKIPPKTRTGTAIHYLLAQKDSLERCITVEGACLDNNAAERAIRPLKIGAKNWLHIGHPDAGPRLARLFSLIENCRLEDIDPEQYLTDIITRLLDHPMSRIAEMLPRQWKALRASASSPATTAAI